MSYKDLPDAERIVLASQYAVILVADMKPEHEVIAILEKDFFLSEQQALQAWSEMQKNYRSEYQSTLNHNIVKLLGGLGFCAFVALMYYFLGSMGGAMGGFVWGFAGLFAFAAIIFLVTIGRMLTQKFQAADVSPRLKYQRPALTKWELEFYGALWFGALIAFSTAGIRYYFQAGTVELDRLTTLKQLVITEPVQKRYTGSKHRAHYYLFRFQGHNNEFRLSDEHIDYAGQPLTADQFRVWDTIDIQIAYNQRSEVEDQYSNETITVYNISQKDGFVVDLAARNQQQRSANKQHFIWSVVAILVVMGIGLGWHLIHFFKWRLRKGVR